MTDLTDFKNKSQEQMVEYAVRMRKRAERSEALAGELLEPSELWSFDTLLFVAEALLKNYPENSIVSNESGDPGARFTYHLREALKAVREVRPA